MSPPNTVQKDILFLITNFTSGTPPSSVFVIPTTCGSPTVEQQLMKNADQPSLIMPPFMMDPTGEVFKKVAEVDKNWRTVDSVYESIIIVRCVCMVVMILICINT